MVLPVETSALTQHASQTYSRKIICQIDASALYPAPIRLRLSENLERDRSFVNNSDIVLVSIFRWLKDILSIVGRL